MDRDRRSPGPAGADGAEGEGRNPVRRDMDLGREYLGGLCAPRGLLSDSRARRPSPVPERRAGVGTVPSGGARPPGGRCIRFPASNPSGGRGRGAPAGGGGGQSGPDLYPPSGGGGLFRRPLRPGVGGVPMPGHKKDPPRTRGGSFLLIPWACPRGRTPCRRRWGAGARRRSGGWGRRRALPGARPFLSRPGRGSCPPGQGRGPPE